MGTGPETNAAPAGRADGAARKRAGSVLVRDGGFAEEDWPDRFVDWSERCPANLPERASVEIGNTAEAEAVAPAFGHIAIIRIRFPSPTDGRGFSLARHLRLLGYRGRLRAAGHLLADQYAMARRSGFDEVEISRELAERQTEEQWLFRANWRRGDYQRRLRAAPRGGKTRQP